jgi:hypothetical protein
MKRSAKLIRLLLFSGAAIRLATPVVAGTADDIIAKARAYLGGDAALSAVHSVHFSGVIETQKATPTGPVTQKASVEIFYQKPHQQRSVVTGPETVETTGLDEYIAWRRVQNVADSTRWQQSVLDPDMIRWLRAMAWENLNFFKGIEQEGGTAEVVGDATIDGRAAVKVAIAHDAKIVFYHYFDSATGKLLTTEARNQTTKEEGEILVNGLRFPQKEIEVIKSLDAKGQPVERTLVITFDKITVNETFPESYFEVPSLPAAGRSSGEKSAARQSTVAPAAGSTGAKQAESAATKGGG